LFADRRKMDLESEKTEKLEAELDRLIERRAKEAARDEERRTVEEEMDKRERARMLSRQRANRDSWLSFHESMHKTHIRIASEHADRRSRLLAEAGCEPDETPGPEAA
jgi:hypothetical protein